MNNLVKPMKTSSHIIPKLHGRPGRAVSPKPPSGLRFLLPLLAVLALAPAAASLRAQIIYTWTGSADSDFGNPLNWVSQAGANAVPGANDSAKFVTVADNYTLNIHNTGPGSFSYQIRDFQFWSNLNGYTIDIQGNPNGIAELDVTGQGVYNYSGNSNNNTMLSVRYLVGNDAKLKYSYTGTANLSGDNGGRAQAILKGNAIMEVDITRTNPPANSYDMQTMNVEFANIQMDPGTTLIVGRYANLRFGTTINYGLSEMAGTIDCSQGGRLYKIGNGYIVISGTNHFVDSPAMIRDQYGYVIPTTVNDATNPLSPTMGSFFTNNVNTIEAGTLIIKSTFGSVYLWNSAHDGETLAGTGTVGSVLVYRGYLSGGNGSGSPVTGKLTINGHLSMTGVDNGAGGDRANMAIDLGKGGNDYDKIYVTGSANIGPKAHLYVNSPNGSMLPGYYEFLIADMGITGTFTNAPGYPRVHLPMSLTMNTGNVVLLGTDDPVHFPNRMRMALTLTQLPFVSVQGLSPGQLAIAKYVDYMYNKVANDPALKDDPNNYDPVIGILNGKSINNQDPESAGTSLIFDPATSLYLLQQGLNQLSPQAYGHIYEGAIASMNTLADNIWGRTDNPIKAADANRLGAYLTVNYDNAISTETLDYARAKLKTYYTTLGVEKNVRQRLTLGGALTRGQGRYELDSAGSVTHVTNNIIDLYGACHGENWNLGAFVLGGTDKNKTTRDVSALRLSDNYAYSDASGKRYGAGLWASTLYTAQWIDVKPYANLSWMNWSLDGFKESGPSSVALDIGKQTQNILQARLGARLQAELFARNTGKDTFFFYVDAAWLSILKGSSPRLVDSTLNDYNMSIQTPALSRNGWRGSAGVMMRFGKHLSVDLGAAGQTGAGLDKQFSYNATVGWKF